MCFIWFSVLNSHGESKKWETVPATSFEPLLWRETGHFCKKKQGENARGALPGDGGTPPGNGA